MRKFMTICLVAALSAAPSLAGAEPQPADPAAPAPPAGPAAPAAPAALGGSALYDRVRAASVEVLVAGHLDGSGWFASEDGLVVTAAHVVWGHVKQDGKPRDGNNPGDGNNLREGTNPTDGRPGLEIISPAAGRLPAEVVCVDRGHDLALLRAESGDRKVPFLTAAEEIPEPAEDALLFGAAYYRHDLLIRGSVARPSPTFEYFEQQGCYVEVYHVTAPSPPGTSGGCWVDRRGRVVGSQSGFVTVEHAGAGIALVAPPAAIRRLVRERTGARTPSLGCGLEELWSQPAGYIARFPPATAGLVPVLLRKGGPAARAGLGDQTLIVALDGRPVGRRDELLSRLVAREPGERVTLRVRSPDSGKESDVQVVLDLLEDPPVKQATAPATAH